MSTYHPQPIKTTGVSLPEDLLELTEAMAKNAHDIWAEKRLSEGWTFGPERDELLKQHPCLVPYESLPESEKEYDRNTSLETLKFIITKGYRIVRIK